MTDHETRVEGVRVEPATDWRMEWDDRDRGLGRLVGDGSSIAVLVEGEGPDRVVTIRGRRIPVSVRTWREQLLAEAETAAREHAGPVLVTATLPGLVVAVAVSEGDEVEEGTPLLTIEAMKMQNEVRAPRAGRVIEISVTPGVPVSTGAPLARIE